jgi:amidase
VAQGNDGGGSIRIPAACCGIFGMKPTRGRVSQAPLFGDILFGLSSDGPMTRTVADAAAMLDAMAGYVTGDPYWAPPPERPFLDEVGADPGRLRVAVTTTGAWDTDVDPECRTAVDDAAELMAELGHEVVEATPDWNGPGVFEPFKTVFQALVGYHPIDDFSVLEPANRALAEAARATDSIEMVKAVVAFQAYSRRVVAFWDDYDLLLTPVTGQPPLTNGAIFHDDPWQVDSVMMRFIPYTPAANMTGQPAISVPLHWSPEGLPIGVQLMGRPADEATLFRVAGQLEQARPWAQHRPSLAAAAPAGG